MRTISGLGELWEGAELTVVDSKDLPKRPRVLVRIPDISEVNTVLTCLKKQNPEFNTSDWSITSQKVTEKEQTLAFSIDSDSHKALTRSNFKAFWGLERIIFWTLKEVKKHLQRVPQVNLHHSRAASAAPCVAMKNCDVALIQEPWTYKGAVRGLNEVGGELIYSRSTQNPRACILIKKGFQILPLTHHCSRDLTAEKIKTSSGRGPRDFILGSAYLPFICCLFTPSGWSFFLFLYTQSTHFCTA